MPGDAWSSRNLFKRKQPTQRLKTAKKSILRQFWIPNPMRLKRLQKDRASHGIALDTHIPIFWRKNWPKVWGITVQISYWEGRWHQNCGYTSPILFFGYGQGNPWKTAQNFFGGHTPWKSLRTQHSDKNCKKCLKILDPAFVAWSWVSATKCGPLAKIWAVAKKSHSHNFRICASKLKWLLAIVYGKKWFTFESSILIIVGVGLFCNG